MGERLFGFSLSMAIVILCASAAMAQPYVIGVVLRNPEKYPEVKDVQIALQQLFIQELQGEVGRELREKYAKYGLEPPSIEFDVRFDTKGEEKAFARKVAKELANDDRVVAVIGHSTSGLALEAGKIYDREKLVLISPTATNPAVTRSSPWVFSMIYDDDWQASMIAAYVAEVMKLRSVLLVYEKGAYGEGLKTSFEKHAQINGLTIADEIEVARPESKPHFSDNPPGLHIDSGKIEKPVQAVLLFVSHDNAVRMVKQLRQGGLAANIPIVGSDALAFPKFPDKLQEASLSSGFDAGKVLVANPYFHELAPLRTHEFTTRLKEIIRSREQHEKKAGQPEQPGASSAALSPKHPDREPSHSSLYAFDAARLITEGIMEYQKDARTQGADTSGSARRKEISEAIRKYLSHLDSVDKARPGMSGKLFLDRNGGAMHRPVLFSWVKNNFFMPAFTQIMEVPGAVPDQGNGSEGNAAQRKENSPWLVVNGIALKKVSVVYAGMDFYRVNDIDLRRQRFDAEVLVWFKWQDPRIRIARKAKDDGLFFWNGIYGIEDKTDLMLRKTDNTLGYEYVAYKVKGTYLKYFDLHRFPFDTQKLDIKLSLAGFGTDQVLLVVDEPNLSHKTNFEIFPKEYSLIEVANNPTHYSGTWRLDSSLGDPYREKISGRDIEFSVYKTTLEIKRDPVPYLLQLFLPLIILSGVSLLVFWIPVKQFQVRITLVLTALLSTLVFHVSRADALPHVGYLTLADYYFVASYCFMTLNIAGTVAIEWVRPRSPARAQTVNSVFRYVLTVVNVFTFLMLAFPEIVGQLGMYSALFFGALLWLLYEILKKNPAIREGFKRVVLRKASAKSSA